VAISPEMIGRQDMRTVIEQISAEVRPKELRKLRKKVKKAYRDCPYFKGMLEEVDRELAKYKIPWHIQGAFLLLYALAATGSLSFYVYDQVEALCQKIRRQ
jgi:hypothetical protein